MTRDDIFYRKPERTEALSSWFPVISLCFGEDDKKKAGRERDDALRLWQQRAGPSTPAAYGSSDGPQTRSLYSLPILYSSVAYQRSEVIDNNPLWSDKIISEIW